MKKIIPVFLSFFILIVSFLSSNTFIDPDSGPLFDLPKISSPDENLQSFDDNSSEEGDEWADWLNYIDEEDAGEEEESEVLATVPEPVKEEVIPQEETTLSIPKFVYVDSFTGITFPVPEKFTVVTLEERGPFRGDWSTVFQNEEGVTLSVTFYDLIVRYPWKGYACPGDYFGIPLERFFTEMIAENAEFVLDTSGAFEVLKCISEEGGLYTSLRFFLHKDVAIGIALASKTKKDASDLEKILDAMLRSIQR